jgi:hypothetical protein
MAKGLPILLGGHPDATEGFVLKRAARRVEPYKGTQPWGKFEAYWQSFNRRYFARVLLVFGPIPFRSEMSAGGPSEEGFSQKACVFCRRYRKIEFFNTAAGVMGRRRRFRKPRGRQDPS